MQCVVDFITTSGYWTNCERLMLAEIQVVLLRACIKADFETSTSDLDEPWAVFYDDADVAGSFIVHVARSGGRYLILWPDGVGNETFDCDNIAFLIGENLRQRSRAECFI